MQQHQVRSVFADIHSSSAESHHGAPAPHLSGTPSVLWFPEQDRFRPVVSRLVRVREEGNSGRIGASIEAWMVPGAYVRPHVEAHFDAERMAVILVKSKRTTDTWDIDTFPPIAVVRETVRPAAVVLRLLA